jgi:hypothetical protein
MRRRCHYVLSSHWDREWYQTFQDYRYRLVRLLDHVLEGFESGRLAGPFTADGQAIVAEDYLEVRPERRAEVERLAQAGQLVLGPWYVMPDEFLVSGEALIRNLLIGRQLARSLGGKPSDAGFICDIFGHNSQMPQIFRGFGIRMAFLWRGTNLTNSRHFIWHSPDGTALPTYRFGDYAYCDYAGAVRHAFEPAFQRSPEQTRSDLATYIASEAACTQVDPVLLFDGGDHQDWDEAVYDVLRERMAVPEGEGDPVVHTSLDAYMDEAFGQIDRVTEHLEGELREPTRDLIGGDSLWLLPGVLSSRTWIKQENAECQSLLCQWAEPLSAFATGATGADYPQGFLDVAWRWLIQNHPHDSICGCSIDAVHENMRYRFAQSREIANRLTVEAARTLAASIDSPLDDESLRVSVFNPLPRPVSEPVELTLHIPAEWPTFNEYFGYEPKPAFRIYAPGGEEIPYQRLSQATNQPHLRIYPHFFPAGYSTTDVRVSLPLTVPALGYTTLTVRADARHKLTRYPQVPGLATSDHSMANEHLAVNIEMNGTLTVYDRRAGETYSHLLTWEDAADIGDGWNYGPAVNDEVYASYAARADVALVHDGPQQATFRVLTAMRVPARFDFSTMTRTAERAELVIDSLITLRRGADRVEVATIVHNTAEDHRLRVLLPSGVETAQTYLADSPFDVVERPIALDPKNHLRRELEEETKPQQSWTAVYAGQRGLAVVSTGLLETAVRDLPERPLALTLFRATRRTVGTAGEPGGQQRGPLAFRFWIVPLAGEPDCCRLCDLGQQLAGGLWDTQLSAQDAVPAYGAAAGQQPVRLPAATSFLSLDAPAVLTSVRRVPGHEGLEIRLFNPTAGAVQTTLDLSGAVGHGYTSAHLVDFESRHLSEAMQLADGRLALDLAAKQILTVAVQ